MGDDVIGIDDLDVVGYLDIGRRHNTLTALRELQGCFGTAVKLEHHALEVQQQVDNIFPARRRGSNIHVARLRSILRSGVTR